MVFDSSLMWIGFIALALVLLVFDLAVLHRRVHEVGVRESLVQTGFYMTLALLFGAFLGWQQGGATALAFYTGYLTEFSLSMDNVFVIALILGILGIPRSHQHRVLFYGILGVMVLRGVMILSGAALVEEYHWTLYIMAAFLVVAGVQMLFGGQSKNPLKGPTLKFLRRYLRVTDELHGKKFFVRLTDKTTGHQAMYMTPLMLALIMVELADVMFAVDSVPAIFAITTDPYVIFTSNVFAILGLRSLYFALAAVLQRFAYLKYALAALLVFIGGKVLVADAWLGMEFPQWLSLAITVLLLAAGILYSLYRTRKITSN